MILLFIVPVLVLWSVSPLFRVIVKHIHHIFFYYVYDLIQNFKHRKDKSTKFPHGISMYIGMFGTGKTLTMTHYARSLYDYFDGNVRILSNYHLNDIPYIPLVNFNQIAELANIQNDTYYGTLVLIDEIEHVLSHRNFSKFPLAMLACLTQQRKLKVKICCTSQRFGFVDKIWRSITDEVVDCKKFWRFSRLRSYDGWEMENASSFDNVKCRSTDWWFVRNKDYDSYDTLQLVRKESADEFISNDEVVTNKGLDMIRNNVKITNIITKDRKRRR